MATISENIQRINKAKSDIKNAIIAKGGSVADNDRIDTYASAIEALPSGGGAELPQNLSRFVTDDWGIPKKITIKGSVAALPISVYRNAPLEDVIIGNGVTSIGVNAFRSCSALTGITIPDSVTSIGSYAFNLCEKLTSIVIPDSVTSINESAFEDCYALTSATIPDSVTSIGVNAFRYCSALTGITIPDSVTSIGDNAFNNCYALTSVVIGNGITSIGNNAFSNCHLKSITIGNSVTSIGDNAFSNCPLKSITIESDTPPTLGGNNVFQNTNMCPIIVPIGSGDTYKSASYWSYYANRIVEGEYVPSFEVTELRYTGQTGTTEFTTKDITEITSADTTTSSIGTLAMAVIGDKVANISENAFSKASKLSILYFSDNSQLETIGDNAFQGCSALTGITIPDSVTSIGSGAFNNCKNLTSVTIGNSVEGINSMAFSYCSSLTGITIPNSVIFIGNNAFNRCSKLTSVTIKATTPPTLENNSIPTNVTAIYVPSDSVDAYKSASGWSSYAYKIFPIE